MANIRTQIAVPPALPGTPVINASRDDIVAGMEVTVDTSTVATTYAWSLTFTPEGSTAVFSGDVTTATPGLFTVDLEGPYMIRLITDLGLPTETVRFVRARFLTLLGSLRLVAAGEQNNSTIVVPTDAGSDGWADDQNFNLQALLGLVSTTCASGRLFYVDPEAATGDCGDYATVQEAIDAADTAGASITSPWAVLVRPGLYIEDVTFKPNIHVLGWPGNTAGAPNDNKVIIRTENAGGTTGHTAPSTLGTDLVTLSYLTLENGGFSTAPILDKSGPGGLLLHRVYSNQTGSGPTVGPCFNISGGAALVDSSTMNVTSAGTPTQVPIEQSAASILELRSSAFRGPSAAGFNSAGADITGVITTIIDCQFESVHVTGRGISTNANTFGMEYSRILTASGDAFLVHPGAGAFTGSQEVTIRWSYIGAPVSFDTSLIAGAMELNLGSSEYTTIDLPGGLGALVVTATTNSTSLFYDNTTTAIAAENVQDAIDEIHALAVLVLTLDDAYDGGGVPGSGRTIVADSGAVQIVDAGAPADPPNPANTDGALQVVGPIGIGSIDVPEIDLDPNPFGSGARIAMGSRVVPNNIGFGTGTTTLQGNSTGTPLFRNYRLRVQTESSDGGTTIGRLILRGGDGLSSGGTTPDAGSVFVQAGSGNDAAAGDAGQLFLAPGDSDFGPAGSIVMVRPQDATGAILTAAGAFVGGVAGIINFATNMGAISLTIGAGDNLAAVLANFNATGQVTAIDSGGGVIELTSVAKGPNGEIYFLNDDQGLALDTALGTFNGQAMTLGTWPSTITFRVTADKEITIGGFGVTGPMIYNADTGKLTVPGLIDPTGVVFEAAGPAPTTATEGAIFVSDGSAGLIAGELYYRPPSNGVPVLIGGAASAPTVAPLAFVYQPGGTPSGNIYASWAALIAAHGAVVGYKEIVFDDTIVSPCVIPPGVYPMTNTSWRGGGNKASTPARALVVFAAGATTITDLTRMTDLIITTVVGAGTPIVYSGGGTTSLTLDHVTVGGIVGSSPIIGVTGGSTLTLNMIDRSVLGGTGGAAPTLSVGATETCNIVGLNATINADAIFGPIGATLTVFVTADSFFFGQPSFAPGLPTPTRADLSFLVSYSPTLPLTAGNVQDALDEVAGLVSASGFPATLAIDNTTGGTDIEVSSGDGIHGEDISGGPGPSFTVRAGDSTSGSFAGGTLRLVPGAGSGAGADGIVRAVGDFEVTGDATISGKLTVVGLIDPTGLILEGAGIPGTTATQGAFFVSDGSGGLITGEPYFQPPSGGTPEILLAGSSAPKTFVFRPSGTASGNVYTDFALLYADLVAAEGRKELVFDNSLIAPSPCAIPSGGPYDMSGTIWTDGGRSQNTQQGVGMVTRVRIEPGATFSEPPEMFRSLFLELAGGAATPFTLSTLYNLHFEHCRIQTLAAGGTPLFVVPVAADLSSFSLADTTFIPAGGAPAVVGITGATTLFLTLDGASLLDDDSLSDGGSGTIAVTYNDAGSKVSSTQTGFSGTFISPPFRKAEAVRVEVDPAPMANVTATEVQGALEDLDAAISAGGQITAPETFVFRPGGVATGNVYTSWALLYTALTGAAAGAKVIVFDDTQSSPCTITAGAFDMTDVSWEGIGQDTLTTLQAPTVEFVSGAAISNLVHVTNLYLHVTVGVTPPPIVYATGLFNVLRLTRCLIASDPGAVPLINVVGGGTVSLFIVASDGTILGNGVEEWLNVGASDNITLSLRDNTQLAASSIAGAASSTSGSIVLDGSSSFDLTQPAWAGFPFPSFSLLDDSDRVIVDPSGMTHVTATEVQPALVELDAAITASGGNEDLAATLILGNITGGSDIIISVGDEIRGVDAAPASGLDGSPLIITPGAGDGAGTWGGLTLNNISGSIGPAAVDLQVGYSTGTARGRRSGILGGYGNDIGGGAATATAYSAIAGGEGNAISGSLGPATHNFIGGGKDNFLGAYTGYNAAFGQGHLVYDNGGDATNHTIVAGRDNQLKGASTSAVFGENNYTTTGDRNLIAGRNHNVFTSNYAVVGGLNQYITSSDSIAAFGRNQTNDDSNYTGMFGYRNEIRTANGALVSGRDNNIYFAAYSLNAGRNNDLYTSPYSAVLGRNNTVSLNVAASNKTNFVFGEGVSLSGDAYANVIGGRRHDLSAANLDLQDSTVFGDYNRVYTLVDNTHVHGQDIRLYRNASTAGFSHNNIGGVGHRLMTSPVAAGELITGNVIGGQGHIVVGQLQHSAVFGETHTIEKFVSNSGVFGTSHTVSTTVGISSLPRDNLLVIGDTAWADTTNQFVQGGGGALGQRQGSRHVLGGTGIAPVFTPTVSIRDNTAFAMRIVVAAHDSAAGNSAGWIIEALVHVTGGTPSIVGSSGSGAPTFSTGGAAAWTITLGVTAFTTVDQFKITAGAATATTKWTATVITAEAGNHT